MVCLVLSLTVLANQISKAKRRKIIQSLSLSLSRLSASDDGGRGDHDAAVPISVAARVRPHPSCLSPAFSGRSRSLLDGTAVQGGNRPLQAGAASGGQFPTLGLLL